ncbi:NfeD family protein [Acetonema longum]|uniref:Membrane protein NfeD2 N-terminal transmembrane domain-containing protein n=1 Tax=Acetonema longum DSM 6540 TaxID=1009370 RepID=F7NJD2_9FIRM|nr:NfeD family protein [Acetonema longum]EGO63880.1 hypothetical protein ALO_10939 [Acetonema longum DSM 6540]
MLEVYWGCLAFGVAFAVITILFGDIADSVFDGVLDSFSVEHGDWFEPVVLVGGVASFGGAGVILSGYTDYSAVSVIVLSTLAASFLSVLVNFVYVRPMKQAENSVGFFTKDLIGKTGEVIIPIPASGYGEVLLKVGAGHTNQIAASSETLDIPAGAPVIVSAVRDGVLYVSSQGERAEE